MLARLTGPMILGMVGIHLFHLVDTFFVGRLGAQELAAMSFTFPVVSVVAGASLGLGLGASAVVSRAIGEGDWGLVRRLTTDSLALAFLIVAFFAIVGFFTIDPLFRLMGATDELLPLIRSYMTVWYAGTLFVVVPMVGNSAIRATGDTRTPSIIMITAACVNGVLDPMFIFGIGPFPRLELAGAALATVIGRSITFTLALMILWRRERMLTRSFPGWRALRDSWKAILHVGIPSALTNMLVPVGIGAITRIVAGYGTAAVAGFGVAMRIETFALTPVMAMRSVIAPFVGQNWGARRHDRLSRGFVISAAFSIGWGLLVWLILALSGKYLATLFNDSPEVVATTTLYLMILPAAYGMRGVLYLSTGALSVLKKPIDAAALMLVQVFALYVPLAVLGSRLLELRGVFGAGLIANVVAGATAYLWTRRVMSLRHAEELNIPAAARAAEPTAGGA